VPAFTDRGRRVVSAKDPYGFNLDFYTGAAINSYK
jgi:hypothetical protein